MHAGSGRCLQAHDRGGTFVLRFVAGKQPILPSQRNRADGILDGILDGVVVDRVAAVVEIAAQCRCPFERVVDRVGAAAVAGDGRS